MIRSPESFESVVMMSSTRPSAKSVCSGSPDRFVNGRTAIDGRSLSIGLADAGRRRGTAPPPCAHGHSDILQLQCTDLCKRSRDLAPDLCVNGFGRSEEHTSE